MHTLWNTIIYKPIYNSLIFIAQNVAMKDVGLAVILLTILIRLILLPLSKKSIVGQYKMRALEPKFALYRQEKINPLSGCLYLLIQLPILFALYFTFIHGVNQPASLYSFLNTNGLHNTLFGIIDITKPFLPLAILAGITQGIQAFLAPKPPAPSGNEKGFQVQFAQSLAVQTKYILPIIIVVISSRLASAVALYWVITNIFSIAQELYFRKTVRLNDTVSAEVIS